MWGLMTPQPNIHVTLDAGCDITDVLLRNLKYLIIFRKTNRKLLFKAPIGNALRGFRKFTCIAELLHPNNIS